MLADVRSTSKKVTIRNVEVGIVLSSAMWRLLDVCAQRTQQTREAYVVTAFDKWAADVPLAKQRDTTFAIYLSSVVATDATNALMLAPRTESSVAANISACVLAKYARHMSVTLQVVFAATSAWSYSHFQSRVRQLEDRSRALLPNMKIEPALLFDVSTTRDYHLAQGVTLPSGDLGKQLVKEVFEDCTVTFPAEG